MKLRPYQDQASGSIDARFAGGHMDACIEIPTGGGKTPVMALTIKRWFETWPQQTRVAVIAHTKELVQQNANKLRTVWPQAPLGICCAGLGRTDTHQPIIYGSIQTMVNRTEEFAIAGGFDVVFIDEAHHIPTDRDEGTYKRFLDECRLQNPNLRIVGLTATPYRLKSGLIYGQGDGHLFSGISFRVGVAELIEQGFLSSLRSKQATETIDASGLHVRAGDYRSDEVDALVDTQEVVAAACDEMIARAVGRSAWIVFCASIDHAEHVCDALNERGVPAGVVHSRTEPAERARVLDAAERGEIRALCNVNVLSEGYDNPRIDCVVMLRPTLSPGLYYQQVGRGFRLHPEKEDCLVLDFAGNCLRHGPVDAINAPGASTEGDGKAPSKVCPECDEVVHAAARECPACEFVFEQEESKPKHETKPTEAPILSSEKPLFDWMPVTDMSVRRHQKPGKPDSVRIDFYCGYRRVSKWLCPDHSPILRRKAVAWLEEQGLYDFEPEAVTTDALLDIRSLIVQPARILVKPGEYPEVLQCEY